MTHNVRSESLSIAVAVAGIAKRAAAVLSQYFFHILEQLI